MKPTEYPLPKALEARVRWLETTLQPSTMKHYRQTVRLFLGYLNQNFPEVRRASQLRRDPHALGWLEYLWKLRTPTGSPLDSSTRGGHVLRSRTLLDLLADLPQPPRPGLLCGQDVPPRQYRLPRPLTPEDDARLQQHWTAATDVLSGALLLQRLTGMRIGECVDLAPDSLRHLGDNMGTHEPTSICVYSRQSARRLHKLRGVSVTLEIPSVTPTSSSSLRHPSSDQIFCLLRHLRETLPRAERRRRAKSVGKAQDQTPRPAEAARRDALGDQALETLPAGTTTMDPCRTGSAKRAFPPPPRPGKPSTPSLRTIAKPLFSAIFLAAAPSSWRNSTILGSSPPSAPAFAKRRWT